MRIEFVEPSLPSRRAWAAVLALAALASVTFAASRVMSARAHASASPVVVPLADLPASSSRPAVPAYDADARRALDRAALPWADALSQLEAVSAAGIDLRTIDVDAAGGIVTVELGVRDDRVLSDYVDQLNAGLSPTPWTVTSVSLTKGMSAPSDAFTVSRLTATIAMAFSRRPTR
jgi:hypothetical protein